LEGIRATPEEDALERIIDLIQPYFAQWGYLIVFGATFLENSAFIGAVIPGDIVLLFAGFYSDPERGALSLGPVMALAFVGAVLGDSTGYLIGRLAGRRLVDRFGRRLFLPAERVERVERYFAEHGVWAVAVGRFAPAVRTVNTFVAGMTRMPFPRFLAAVTLAAAVWSVLVPVLGLLFSGSLDIVQDHLGTAGLVVLLGFIVLLVFTYRRTVKRIDDERLLDQRRFRGGKGRSDDHSDAG
jgi:membrane protein DedA with SNARE-associated domain